MNNNYTKFPKRSAKLKRVCNLAFYNDLYDLMLLRDIVLLSFWFFSFGSVDDKTYSDHESIRVKGQSISVELIPMQLHYIFLQELLIYNRNQLEPICITDFNFRSVRNYSENRGFEYIGIIVEGTCEVHFE